MIHSNSRKTSFTANNWALEHNSYSEYCQPLICYFNFVYYLSLSPYRIVFNDGQFSLHSWRPQKLISLISLVLSLLWILRSLRDAVPKQKKLVTTDFFQVTFSISAELSNLLGFKTFWFSGPLFVEICNSINAQKSPQTVHKRSYKWGWYLVIFTVISLFCASVCIQTWAGLKVGSLSGGLSQVHNTTFWDDINNAGRRNLFLHPKSSLQLQWFDHLIGTIAVIGLGAKRLIGIFADLLVLSTVLSVWLQAREFRNLLKNDEFDEVLLSKVKSPQSVVEILEKLTNLKDLIRIVNTAVGTNITVFMCEFIMYFSTYFEELLKVRGSLENKLACVTLLLLYVGISLGILILAADTAQKVSYFEVWLSDESNRKYMTLDETHMLFTQIDNNSISIKGSGMFPITYSSLANLLSVTVTYFIICLDDSKATSARAKEKL